MAAINSIISSPLCMLQVSSSMLAMVCGGFGFLLLLGVFVFKKPIEKINFYNMSDQDDSDFERRRSERLQDPVQVKVQIIDGNNNKSRTHFEFVNKDISENGIFIISNDLDILKPGQEINISVFDERGPVFEGMGQVVHRQAVFSPEMVAEEGGFGIRFIKKAIV